MINIPVLSICIPTYNRAVYLREAVESVLRQINEVNRTKVEIVISDNASDDSTNEYAQGLRAGALSIVRYQRNEHNVEFDHNCLKVVGLARGEYCWLLGDDDQLTPGAVDRILSEIEKNPDIDIFICNRSEYGPDMRQERVFIPEFTDLKDTIYDFTKITAIDYLRAIRNVMGLFNCISTQVFRRDKWLATADKEKKIGSGYIHVYIMMAILWAQLKGKLKYLAAPLVKIRLDNERLIPDNKFTRRLAMEVVHYHAFAQQVLVDSSAVRLVDKIVLRSSAFSWAVNAKIGNAGQFYGQVIPILLRYYWRFPGFWLRMVPLIFTPAFLIKYLRVFYRKNLKPIIIKMLVRP